MPELRADPLHDWPPGGGEMGALMRRLDWSKTPLGPPSSWSASLRMAVRFLLANRFPLLLWWGPQYISIYNDAYIPVLGKKHPAALGQPVSECWNEIWHILKPLIDTPYHGGPATWMEDIQLEINRHGFVEETHFTIAYSPLPDESEPSGIGGVLATVHEISEKVVGERRVVVLRDLGVQAVEAKSAEEACSTAAQTLSRHPMDVPFALIYLLDPERSKAQLAGCCGISAGEFMSPAAIDLEARAGVWDLSAALKSDQLQIVEDLSTFGTNVHAGPWSDPPRQAVISPIPSNIAHQLAGFLVIGLSSRLKWDDSYRSFIELATSQIATAITNARSFEEEKRRAESLAELDRAKTVFFSNVSHEFRTPLTLMLSPLEEVLRNPDVPSGVHAQLEVAHRNTLRLQKLVNHLLDFSRIEAGRIKARYEPVDLDTLTIDLASAFRSAVEAAGMELIVNCPPLPTPVYVDREMWEKIVLNLISNAFKFTFSGRIEVSLKSVEHGVKLIVRDTGTGIPATELPRIFERFHRVENAQARTYEGSGIGLALVQELARLHGGTVRVESEIGHGTAFFVSIPYGSAHLPAEHLAPSPAATVAAPRAAAFVEEALRWLPDRPGSESVVAPEAEPLLESPKTDSPFYGKRILVVDDNSDMREYVQRLLAPLFVVEAAADGMAALEEARLNPPDLVLTDVMMPRLDGFGLLRALRDDPVTAAIPIVMLSARAGEESRLEGIQAGADDYLIKPFSARELLARVEGALRLQFVRQQANHAVLESQKQMRKALAESEKAGRLKDEFLATLSHELRTPLNSILGWAHMLQSRALDSETVRSAVSAIYNSAKTQAQIIDDLLDVARIMAGQMSLRPTTSALSDILNAAITTVGHAIRAKKIKLHLHYDNNSENLALYADSQRLQQVFWNLLFNAVKFSSLDGKIEILVEQTPSEVSIAIRDHGVGISPEFLPHVFERFRQADSSTSRKYGGLGLGLAISRNLVELHGGTVQVESAGEGRGATFIIRLPIVKQDIVLPLSPALRRDSASEAFNFEGLRLLLVDDDVNTLEVMRTAFEFCGAETRSSQSAAEALTIVTDWNPHLLISDIGMPGRDGYWLIREVRSLAGIGQTLPAMALTAYASTADRLMVLSAGYNSVVVKPVEPAGLLATAATLVPQRSANIPNVEPYQRAGLLAGKKVLLVEDDTVSIEVFRVTLEGEGVEVRSAVRASQALDVLRQWRPDILISDLGLPDEDGYSLIKKIRSLPEHSETPAVALTGYGAEEGERAVRAGFHMYKSKPLEPNALLRLLNDLVARS